MNIFHNAFFMNDLLKIVVNLFIEYCFYVNKKLHKSDRRQEMLTNLKIEYGVLFLVHPTGLADSDVRDYNTSYWFRNKFHIKVEKTMEWK